MNCFLYGRIDSRWSRAIQKEVIWGGPKKNSDDRGLKLFSGFVEKMREIFDNTWALDLGIFLAEIRINLALKIS